MRRCNLWNESCRRSRLKLRSAILLGRVGCAKVGREIDDKLSMHNKIIVGLFQIPCEHFYREQLLVYTIEQKIGRLIRRENLTITTHLSIDDISNAHVDNTEKPLVLLLELLLVENLNGKDAVFIDTAARTKVPMISRSAGK